MSPAPCPRSALRRPMPSISPMISDTGRPVRRERSSSKLSISSKARPVEQPGEGVDTARLGRGGRRARRAVAVGGAPTTSRPSAAAANDDREAHSESVIGRTSPFSLAFGAACGSRADHAARAPARLPPRHRRGRRGRAGAGRAARRDRARVHAAHLGVADAQRERLARRAARLRGVVRPRRARRRRLLHAHARGRRRHARAHQGVAARRRR